ncbi:hypothetical protein PHSY_002195 [Pseudozyma hubeiensis SY62]|uniref:Uncharacterized protein n=1 Tax=Pseudozyma hubeiensis (strain SY62) TaxID=1305764 RepID=R9P0N7_PSEHS|nr:hypothetical protein PHSY_002195 [Pseudozyma hubeiensis SY62]GAC94622.1 hypothetical protein PHSY_002195 [Pseudozyma hubeiensis SY62]
MEPVTERGSDWSDDDCPDRDACSREIQNDRHDRVKFQGEPSACRASVRNGHARRIRRLPFRNAKPVKAKSAQRCGEVV